MASRKEQKEAARARRIAEERARQERARRERRLRMLAGTLIGAVAVVAVAIAVASGSSGHNSSNPAPIHPSPNGVALPARKITSLVKAAQAAGCSVIDTPDSIARTSQNRQHVSPGTALKYATNPPSYGPHYPTPASDGEYPAGHTPAVGFLVHAMEHGRVEYQYRPGLPAADIKQLESLFNETDGRWAGQQMLLLFQNTTGMPYDVAATAWGHVLGCKTFGPRVFDAFRAFRLAHTNQGPEFLGTGPE
jgi:hypothetical protein